MHAIRASGQGFERRFYLGASLAFLVLVFWTFARTYYLKLLLDRPPLPLRLHIHGMVMSGWVLLLALQSSLVLRRRIQWHRWVGTFGAAWAVLVVILGATTTLHAAAREVRAHTPLASGQVVIVGLELTQMLLFAGYVSSAMLLRRRGDYHKRLMLLTLACMLPSTLARLPVGFMTNGLILFGLDVAVVTCVSIDSLRNGRLHPAFAWGASIFLVAMHLAFYGTLRPAWIAFASGLLA